MGGSSGRASQPAGQGSLPAETPLELSRRKEGCVDEGKAGDWGGGFQAEESSTWGGTGDRESITAGEIQVEGGQSRGEEGGTLSPGALSSGKEFGFCSNGDREPWEDFKSRPDFSA